MQIDMHYHATFCMAYAAGFTMESAQQVATASQYVDDNTGDANSEINFKDGSAVYLTPTAHHPTSAIKNLQDEEQRTVWVPFHFIPGNEGDTYQERLLATKDSEISQKITDFAVDNHHKSYSLQLLGIAAHCYADTFSHYGFCGLSSPLNVVDVSSTIKHELRPDIRKYVDDKESAFFERFGDEIEQASGRFLDVITEQFEDVKDTVQSSIANISTLGHGGVLTYPDRPYLNWEFSYKHERTTCTTPDNRKLSIRDNPATFLEACEALHRVFSAFLEKNPSHKRAEGGMDFSSVLAKTKENIDTQGRKEDRIKIWEDAFKADYFGKSPSPLSDYLGSVWLANLEKFDGAKTSEEFIKTDVYKFYQAAEQHRAFVLRDLLPSYGLAVK